MFKKFLENVPGTAASLARQLREGPQFKFNNQEQSEFIYQRSVVDSLFYERPFNFRYPPNVDRSAIAQIKNALDANFNGLMTDHRLEGFSIDLRSIKGVVNIHSTNVMTAHEYCAGCTHLPRTTDADFDMLLADSVYYKPPHVFWHRAWEQDYFWDNDCRAANIIAAQAQALEQGRTCMVNGLVHEVRLNRREVDALTSQVSMLMVPHTTFFGNDKIFNTLVEKHEVPIAWLDGNIWAPGATVVLLPKDNDKAVAATEALISLGAIEINSELQAALANQHYVTHPNHEISYSKPSAAPGF